MQTEGEKNIKEKPKQGAPGEGIGGIRQDEWGENYGWRDRKDGAGVFIEHKGGADSWNKKQAGERTTDKGWRKIISDWNKWQAKWRTTRILF